MSSWEVVWFIFVGFAFTAYLIILYFVIVDLFRDPDAAGPVKATWVAALVLVPVVSAVVYLLVNGRAMAVRADAAEAA
jgi:heme/copper-type cytochrome/quinol oxidase subunit 4